MRVLVVGFGEIGRPLYELVKGVHGAEQRDIEPKQVTPNPDVMHVTFPENNIEEFVMTVVGYVKEYHPRLVLIESTVSPNVTANIYERIKPTLLCHSPVRGNVHEGIKKGLLQYTKYVGPTSVEAGELAKEYYEGLGMKVKLCKSPTETELGKLLSTAYLGVMIAWFQEVWRICGTLKADYNEVVGMIGSTETEGDRSFGHARPILFPGHISGHCVIPNIVKVNNAYPTKLLDSVLESNARRGKELNDI
jgi:UDP-glucose 6-dehydrogenase